MDEFIDAQSCSNDHYTFVKRIKFSIKKDELDGLITALKDSRQSLDDIANAHAKKEVALSTISPRVAGLARLFDRIQGHAVGLYSGIRTAWAEKCHSNHTARLLLNSWPEAISTKRNKPPIAFEMAFVSTSQPDKMESSKEIVIEMLHEDDLEEPPTDQYVLIHISCRSILIIWTELGLCASTTSRRNPDSL